MSLLPEEIKTKWIEALRSGEYPQTTGAFYRDEEQPHAPIGYCCLGVLERICGTPLEEMKMKGEFHEFTTEEYDEDGNEVTVSTSRVPASFRKANVVGILIDMNDGNSRKDVQSHTFLQIADYIEKNV